MAEEKKVTDSATEGTEVEKVVEFDPATVDVNDTEALARLSEDELEMVSNVKRDEDGKVLPEKEVEKEVADDAPPTGDTAGKATGDTASAGDQQVKYADKYATSEDLVKGVEGLFTKLGYDNDIMRGVLAQAVEDKQFKSVERMYKALEVELGKRGSSQSTTQPAPESSPVRDTTTSDTVGADDKDFVERVSAVAFGRLQGTQLEQELRRRGLELPRTTEEFDALKEGAPYYAMRFEQEFKASYDSVARDAYEHTSTLKSKDTHDLGIINSDTQALKEFATANELKLTDAEIETAKAQALASPYSYDVKAGVKLLRPDAIKEYFFARVLPAKVKEMQTSLLAKGRMEASEDLEKLHKKTVKSVGTSNLTTRSRTKKVDVNVDNPDEVSALTDEQLENFK